MLDRIVAVTLAALFATAVQAGWEDHASAYDANRLAHLDEARAKAVSEAEAGHDMGTIRTILDPAPHAVSARELMGDWQCRTIKLGGMTPDVIYAWFHCRVGQRDGSLYFAKVSGSQHLAGILYPHESGGFVLLAGWSVAGEPVHWNSGNHLSVGAEATPDDAIGLLTATGPGRARIEFPYPVQESTFDVIELRR
jgi:hypothetical protein